MTEWLDIETAPKDGTKVLFASEYGIEYGWYSCSEYLNRDDRDKDGGAWVTDDPRNYWITSHPTHWMPLPSPPA